MPKVLVDFLGYVFFFWSREEDRPHVHVCKGRPSHTSAKFWITSDGVEMAHNNAQISPADLRKIAAYLESNRQRLLAAWAEHFA